MVAEPVAMLHPLTAGVGELAAVLDRMPVGSWDGLADTEVRDLVSQLRRIESRVCAHTAAGTRVLEESGLAKRSGASSTGALLAGDFGGDRAAGDRMVRTGQVMQAAPVVEQALAEGRVTERQAKAIAGGTRDLDIDQAAKQKCQEQLLKEAEQLTAKDLERRVLRIADLSKPPAEADADENANLERREARAWAKAAFRMTDNRDGTHSGEFTIPEAQADMLRSVVESMAAPRRDHLNEQTPDVGSVGADRLGRAFAQLCDHLTAEKILSGGPTMVVKLDHDTLLNAAKPATLSTGTRISASEARLTACNAGIIPAVYGGKSVALDFGQQRRLFSPAQKLALADRDGGCTFPGCDRPPSWCEAHHWRQSWQDGGTTNLEDGVLLCAHHHRTVHAQHWRIRMRDGKPEYSPSGSSEWKFNKRWRPDRTERGSSNQLAGLQALAGVKVRE